MRPSDERDPFQISGEANVPSAVKWVGITAGINRRLIPALAESGADRRREP